MTRDWDQIASEFLRALRGRRSQLAFSRRLKYRSNVAYLWESGRNWPTAAKALWAASRVGIDVPAGVRRFLDRSPDWASCLGDGTGAPVCSLLNELRGSTPIRELAARSGKSRFAVSRWLKGTAQPRLPEFFAVVDAASQRLPDLLASLIAIEELPSLVDEVRELHAARELSNQQPWAPAVLLSLELARYRDLPTHEPGWIAAQLGIDGEVERRCLHLLERSGQIRRDDEGRWAVSHVRTIDTRNRPRGVSSPKRWWAEQALSRIDDVTADGTFAYNVCSVSNADYEVLKEMQLKHFQAVRFVVAQSEPCERLVVTNLQLFAIDDGKNDEHS